MKKEKNVKKKSKLGYAMISLLVIGMMLGYMTLPHPVLKQDEETGSWHILWEGNLAQAAEADPGSGASGILEVYILNYTAGAVTENTTATIEGWCDANGLGYASADDSEIDIAHSTSFMIVVRVRGNATHCKVGSVWFNTNLRVRVTCTSLGIAADTEFNASTSSNNTDYDFLYMNFYDGGAAGYTISQDQTIEITSIKFEAYY